MKTAYGYSRYSSASQSDGSTIQTQQDAIENYCIDHGIKLLNHYADLAISGKDAEHRREFLKMIHDAVVTKVDYIIVYTRDRFSRSVKDFVKYLQILADNDTSLICVSENTDSSTATGKLNEWVMMSLAQYYIENLSREALRGLRYNAEHCIWNTSPPFGYLRDKETGKLVIEPEQAKMVKRIYKLFVKYQSYQKVVDILADEDGLTKFGKKNSYAGIHHILTNRVYIGEYRYNIKAGSHPELIVIPNGVPKILSDQLFLTVAKLIEIKTRKYSHRDTDKGILYGKILCGYTNTKFRKCLVKVNDNTDAETYVYFTTRKKKNKKYANSIGADLIEDFISLLVSKVLLSNKNNRELADYLRIITKNTYKYYKKQYSDASKKIVEIKEKLSLEIENIASEDSSGIDQSLLLIKKYQREINTLESIQALNLPIIQNFDQYMEKEIKFSILNLADQYVINRKKCLDKVIDSVSVFDDVIRVKVDANAFVSALPNDEYHPKNIFFIDVLRNEIESISKQILYKKISLSEFNFRRLLE